MILKLFKMVGIYAFVFSLLSFFILIYSFIEKASRETIILSLQISLVGAIISAIGIFIDKRKLISFISLIICLIPWAYLIYLYITVN